MVDASWWPSTMVAFGIGGFAFAFAPFNREASGGVAREAGAWAGFLGILTAAWQAGWLPG